MKRSFSPRFLVSLITFFLLLQPSFAATGNLDDLPAASIRELVAPIALYPDPLLGLILPASVFPEQIVDAALLIKTQSDAELIAKQSWDQSVKGIATYPGVLKMMYEKIDWTTKLGTAFINQNAEVRDAIQSLRTSAQQQGNLKTTPEQQVATKTVEGQTIIVIEPKQPEVIYVPQYNPTVVYTEPVAPSYNYLTPLATFGIGMAVGAAMNNDHHDHYYYGGYPGGVAWYSNGSYNNWVDNRQDMIRDAQHHRQDVQKDRINYRQDAREDRTNFRQDRIESGNVASQASRDQIRQNQAAKRGDNSGSSQEARQNKRASMGESRNSITPNTEARSQAQQRSNNFKSSAADRGYNTNSAGERGNAKSSGSWSTPRGSSGTSSSGGYRRSNSSSSGSAFSGYSSRSSTSAYSSRGSSSRSRSGFSGGGGRRGGGGGGRRR